MVRWPPKPIPGCSSVGGWSSQVRPVRKLDDPPFLDTDLAQVRTEVLRGNRSGLRLRCCPPLQRRRGARYTSPATDTTLPGRGGHEVLEDQAVRRMSPGGEIPCEEPTAQTRDDTEDDVRPLRPRERTVKKEGRLVHGSPGRRLRSWNIVAAAKYADAAP